MGNTTYELKNRAFTPGDAGQLNFYLSVINDKVKTERDNPSIGLMLCRDKNNIVVEYALEGMSQPMGEWHLIKPKAFCHALVF